MHRPSIFDAIKFPSGGRKEGSEQQRGTEFRDTVLSRFFRKGRYLREKKLLVLPVVLRKRKPIQRPGEMRRRVAHRDALERHRGARLHRLLDELVQKLGRGVWKFAIVEEVTHKSRKYKIQMKNCEISFSTRLN